MPTSKAVVFDFASHMYNIYICFNLLIIFLKTCNDPHMCTYDADLAWLSYSIVLAVSVVCTYVFLLGFVL